jgi:hypothetical protein
MLAYRCKGAQVPCVDESMLNVVPNLIAIIQEAQVYFDHTVNWMAVMVVEGEMRSIGSLRRQVADQLFVVLP